MKNHQITFYIIVLVAFVFVRCKNSNVDFSPGPGDERITGTWQLLERHYPKDSSKSVLTINRTTQRDSISFLIGGQTIKKDTLITIIDTIYVRRDTSFYKTQRYPNAIGQNLIFASDGKLSSTGNETTYYRPYSHYRVDKTYPDSLLIDLFIQTNGATYPVRQGLAFRLDTLIIKHRCDQPCYSKFLRIP